MAQTLRSFAEVNAPFAEQSNMFEFPPTEEIFPWNKVDEDPQDNGDTGLPSGDGQPSI